MVIRILMVLLILLFLMTGQMFSLTLAKASVEELTKESVIIVHGTVQSIESRWEDDTHRSINTYVQFSVKEYVKGEGPQKIVIVQMGGRIGDFGDVVSGSPQLTPGEELLLFLFRSNEYYKIHSIALGCFWIFSNEKKETVVMNDLRNVNLVDPVTRKEVQPEEYNHPFPLDAFINEIRPFVLEN